MTRPRMVLAPLRPCVRGTALRLVAVVRSLGGIFYPDGQRTEPTMPNQIASNNNKQQKWLRRRKGANNRTCRGVAMDEAIGISLSS